MIYFALSFLFITLETLTVWFLALAFAPLARPKHAWWAILAATAFLWLEGHFLSWEGPAGSAAHTFFLLATYTLLVRHLFSCRAVVALALADLAALFLIAVDCVVLSASLLIYPMEEQLTRPVFTYGYSLLAKLLEFGGGASFCRWRRRRLPLREPDTAGWLLLLSFSLPVYLLSQYLARFIWYAPNTIWICLGVSTLVTFICVGAFFLLDYSGRRREADRENMALRQDLKLETAHIAAMEGRYTQQRRQTHDFKNQLAVLRDMALRDTPREEFAAYLDAVLDTQLPGVLYIDTHRTVVDVLLSEKVPAARDKGIDFQYQLDDLAAFPLPDDALVVALANLIDNAVEACEKIPAAAERHILLKMKMKDDIALLGIENTTATPVPIRGNTVATTKADPLAHGWGLKNAAAMIERSGGMWFIEYRDSDKRFCFSASIPRPARQAPP